MKIESFAKIKANEFYGNSPVISLSAIQIALALNNKAISFAQTNAFPTITGGVVLAIYTKNYTLRLEVKPNLFIDAILDEDDEEILDLEDINVGEAESQISYLYSLCRLPELSTGDIGMTKKIGLLPQALALGLTGLLAFSQQFAPQLMAGQSVNISKPITEMKSFKQKSPSFGFSNLNNSEQNIQK